MFWLRTLSVGSHARCVAPGCVRLALEAGLVCSEHWERLSDDTRSRITGLRGTTFSDRSYASVVRSINSEL